jgi:2C-methyl-D-erythritol 2,4-cyclodiphosphate synthase
MSENELKSVVAKYQQKSFELFNSNIVLEVQVETLQATINSLRAEIETLKKPKRGAKSTGDFE